MSKDVIINGVTYTAVPYVNIPLAQGDGSAKFVDTDGASAGAGDIRQGKTAWVAGSEVTGSVSVRGEGDVSVSGKNVSVAPGIYDQSVTKAVAEGTVVPSAELSSEVIGTGVSDYPVSVVPKASVSAPGYVSSVANGSTTVKYIQVETKTASPSTSAQTILPSSGKLLKSVSVQGVSLQGTATAADVLSGKTFYSTGLNKLTGTATVPTISQDSATKVLNIV